MEVDRLSSSFWSRASFAPNEFEARSSAQSLSPDANRIKYAAISYAGHGNLGDEIQGIAVLRFLPRVDALVARERLDEFSSLEAHKIILNGWFLHSPEHWPPAPSLRPLIISFHLTRLVTRCNERRIPPSAVVLKSPKGLDYLKRYEPIGARDLDTLAQLQAAGVETYFSGCLTLTLRLEKTIEGRSGIYAVDVPDEVYAYFSRSQMQPITRLTHDAYDTEGVSHFDQAMALLRLYATAKAVITSRLHCALPCLALNTPVLFIENAADNYRFDGLRDLMKHGTIDDVLNDRCDFNLVSPPANDTKWHGLRDELISRCTAFVKSGMND